MQQSLTNNISLDNTKNNNTEISNIYPINPDMLTPEEEGQASLSVVDELDKRKSYRQMICENIDFDFIEKGQKNMLPKDYEWYGAFGLLVTILWLYNMFSRRDK